MEFESNMYVSPSGLKWVEDLKGVKPCVKFDDFGQKVFIIMESFIDSAQVIGFNFVEGKLNLNNEIVTYSSLQVQASKNLFIEVSTGIMYDYNDAHEDDELKEGFVSEFDYYIDSFGKSSNQSYSIYDKIQAFIKNKLSNGLSGFVPFGKNEVDE